MSSPGGSGRGSPNDHGHQQFYDPITGQPVSSSQPTGYDGDRYSSSMQYQGFGVFSGSEPTYPGMVTGYPQSEPPRKKRGSLIAALSAAIVALVAIVTTVALINLSGHDSRAGRSAAPAATSAPASSDIPAPPSEPQTPVVPGWQAVSVPRRTAVYDVPREWTLEKPDAIIGFGEPNDPVSLSGVAIYQKGFCPGHGSSFRALAGATARKGPDDATVAADTAQKLAAVAYSANGAAPKVTLSTPEPIELGGGSIHGMRVVATVIPPAAPCNPQTAVISVLATSSTGQSSVVHAAIADQGVPGAVPPETLQQIAASFRPAR